MNRKIKHILKENNILEKELTKENQKIMTDIIVYIRTFPLSLRVQESVRKDI